MLEKKHLLNLGLISLAAITVGAAAGLVLNYQTIKELRSGGEVVAPPPPEPPIREEEKIATYSGKIKPSLEPEIASHYLEDEDGKAIIFLKSGKIEADFLGMMEGQAVEVVGKVGSLESGQEILEVDEVRL